MAFKGGRLELLVPHMLRGQLLRPGFVRLSLRLGAARKMPLWAKLQFLHSGVSPEELDAVRRRVMRGYLRVPREYSAARRGNGRRVAPVVVMFNGTNAVKEELHWWGDALLEHGIAVLAFDGPGMGHTFHRMSMVAEPRPVGE